MMYLRSVAALPMHHLGLSYRYVDDKLSSIPKDAFRFRSSFARVWASSADTPIVGLQQEDVGPADWEIR
jgi:hypothetical protein